MNDFNTHCRWQYTFALLLMLAWLLALGLFAGVRARRLLYTRAERLGGNAAAAQQLTMDRIETAVAGDLPVSSATTPNRVAAMIQDGNAGRMLITKMEQREDNAVAAQRFTAAQIQAAAAGDLSVTDATAPKPLHSVSAIMQDNVAGRILITKMEQREDNAAAAERFTAAQIDAAASGDMAVSDIAAPKRLSAMTQDDLSSRILIAESSQQQQQQQQQQVRGRLAEEVQERILLNESNFAAAFGKQLDASERIQKAADGLMDVRMASAHNY
jgi:hypothetical protein